MTILPDPFSSFSNILLTALGDALHPEAATFLDMVADDVVMEFPYAPDGAVKEVRGKSALAEYLSAVGSLIQIKSMTLSAVYPASQAGIFILEFTGSGVGTQTGIPYEQSYISVISIEAGRILRYRDYWNPLVAQKAMGKDAIIATPIENAVNAA